jgi:hypothetical protein
VGAASSGAGSGFVIGLCLVLLGQQFGYLDLSSLLNAILDFVVFAVGFAVVFGLVGLWLGHRYLRKHSGLTPWKSSAVPAETVSSAPDAEPK